MNTTLRITIQAIQCCSCAVWFGIDSTHNDSLLEKGGSFYCTNGHSQHYTDTEVDKLRQKVASLESWNKTQESWLRSEKYSHAATKGKLTKTKNRIANGICPCCNRSFQNLNRHMAGQHPEYISKVAE